MGNNDFPIDRFSENNLDELSMALDEKDIREFWHKSMKNITLGFMFTVMTFNFLWLQYILPTLAAALLYVGFRNLRKENKALNIAWIFSIINMIYNVLNLIYVNTPLNVNVKSTSIMAFISTVFQISFLIVFREGIKKIFYKVDAKPKKDPILGLIIWRIILVTCALTELGQIWFISIPIIIYYFYIFKSLYKLSYDLETINYIPSKITVMINKKKLSWLYTISCIFIVGVCCVFSNHIKLDSIEVIPVKEFGTRNMLIDKGVPVKIVKDIVDEDIIMLKDIVNVETFSEELKFNSTLNNIRNNFDPHNNINKSSGNDLEATSIFIELKNNEMYAIEYFNWGEGGPYWQDGFAISGSQPLELINGRLLYESEGINYSDKIPRLKGGMVASTDIFGYERQDEKITGAINYPSNSKNQRGYVFYKIDVPIGIITIGANIVNYMHYNHPFRIPYAEVENENLMFNDHLRQHFTNFKTKTNGELMDN